MIRLAVSDAHDTVWQQLAPRLRGAVLETCGDDSPRTCDAGVFFHLPDMNGAGIKRFLDAGKRVLLSADVWWASEAVQALPGVEQVAVTNLDRYLPSRQLIWQQLDAGKLGEPGLIRLYRWESPATEVRGPHDLPVSLLRDLDLVLWFFEKKPSLVHAIDGPGIQVHLGFPGGGMALLDITHQLPAGGGYHSLSVIGSAGSAYADDHQNMQMLYQRDGLRPVLTEEGHLHHAAAVQAFVDALNTGHDLSVHLTACRQVLAVATAVRLSLQLRRAIELEGGR